MKRDKLDKFLGKNVKVVIWDGYTIFTLEGELGQLDLVPKFYYCGNSGSRLFCCSHAVKIEEVKE